jgi:hypothetical protein
LQNSIKTKGKASDQGGPIAVPISHSKKHKEPNFLCHQKHKFSHTEFFQKNSQSHQTNSQTQSQNNKLGPSKPETENNSETRLKSEREKVEAFCFFSSKN